jgi:hypothetical protein
MKFKYSFFLIVYDEKNESNYYKINLTDFSNSIKSIHNFIEKKVIYILI